MFQSTRGRDVTDASISESIDSLQGLSSPEKIIIYNHIMDGLDMDISNYENNLSLAEKAGPGLWQHLHWMGRMADIEKDPSIYTTALSLLLRAHPCASVCRKHLDTNLKLLPTSSYASMMDHSIDLHNLVNSQLGKPQFSRREAYNIYDPDCDTCVFEARPNAGSMH